MPLMRPSAPLKMPETYLSDDNEESWRTRQSDGHQHLRKPEDTFEVTDTDDIERGVNPKGQQSQYRRWLRMGARERKIYPREGETDEVDGLLGEDGYGDGDGEIAIDSQGEKTSRKWHERCLCGGNTALSILAILLVLNLIFGSTTYSRLPQRPDPFKNWGASGTTSEGLSWYPTDFLRDVQPVPCHSHNDYWRRVPLFSALYAGCISVEADVWKVANSEALLVGHNTASLTQNRTFQSLYIEPLVKILERQNPSTSFYNGTMHGVFDTDPEQGLTLLVDIKTKGEVTWPFLVQQLEPLRRRDWLTYIENGTIHYRPVTVVGTGETPFDALTSNSTYRDYFFDAPLDQMYESNNASATSSPQSVRKEMSSESIPLAPATIHKRGQGNSGTSPDDEYTFANSWYASTEFNAVIGRIWWGGISDKQLELIRGHVRGAHRRGLKVRYWGTPSWPISLRNHVWEILAREGADVINADDLEGVAKGLW